MLTEIRPSQPGRFGRLALGGLLAGAFFLPFVPLIPGFQDLLPGFYLWDRQRTLQMVLILAGLLSLLMGLATTNVAMVMSGRLMAGWIGIGGVSLLSAFLAHYPLAALLDWAWMNALFALVLLCAWLFRQNQKLEMHFWLIPTGLASLVYIFWFFVTNSDQFFAYDFRDLGTIFPGFANSRYFADFLAVLLFLAPLAADRYLVARRERMLGWSMVALLYALAFVTGARSILAGQLVAHVVLFMTFRKAYGPLVMVYLKCWLFGLALFLVIFKVYAPWSVAMGAPDDSPSATKAVSDTTYQNALPRFDSSGRGELFSKSYRLIATAPWLGIGGRHFGCYLKADYVDRHNRNNGDATHPHNAFLQLFVEWGGLVAISISAAVAWLFYLVARGCKQREGDRLDLALLGALLALGTHAMVTGVLNSPITQMLLVVLLGWCMARCSRFFLPGERGAGTRAVAAVLIFGLMCCISILFSMEMAELPQLNKRYANEDMVTWYLAPRFWQQGWLLPLCGKI